MGATASVKMLHAYEWWLPKWTPWLPCGRCIRLKRGQVSLWMGSMAFMRMVHALEKQTDSLADGHYRAK
eukprot:1159561-Pelagomonas_calceolata.AAC.2